MIVNMAPASRNRRDAQFRRLLLVLPQGKFVVARKGRHLMVDATLEPPQFIEIKNDIPTIIKDNAFIGIFLGYLSPKHSNPGIFIGIFKLFLRRNSSLRVGEGIYCTD